MAKVKCPFCQQTFDREKEPFIKIGRRYAHLSCAEAQDKNILEEEKNKEKFFQLVKTIYGSNYNFMMINKQANNFIKQYNYTWSGMTKSLYWFYIINHGSLEESNGGIGIIPYVYDKAKDYYYNQYITQEKNKNKKYSEIILEFNIQPPKKQYRLPHLLNLGDE